MVSAVRTKETVDTAPDVAVDVEEERTTGSALLTLTRRPRFWRFTVAWPILNVILHYAVNDFDDCREIENEREFAHLLDFAAS